MKLIIDIPEEIRNETLEWGVLFLDYVFAVGDAIKNGTPLEDVKAKIHEKVADYVARGYADSAEDFEEYSRIVNQTFDNIGNSESEDKE